MRAATDEAAGDPAPGDLATRLRALALQGGAVGFGITSARPFDDVARSIEQRKADGMHGRMSFTFGDPRRSTDVTRSFPWARHLVVLAWSYMERAGHPGDAAPATGRIARFATEDHYAGLRRCLQTVGEALQAAGFQATVLCDDNRLVDRAAAVRAGVGWWGKNTMVLRPGAGPWTLLGSVVTDAPLEPTPPMKRDCGTCDACLPACPTGALVSPGVLDARRCLAHVLQSPDFIPIALRSMVGDRVYGCDDCLEACPPGEPLSKRVHAVAGRVDLRAMLAADDVTLLAEFDHFYIPRRKPDFLRRNAIVALGNTGLPSDVTVLDPFLSHADPMLRAHAAWALGTLGGPRAIDALRSALETEYDEVVRIEISEALARADSAAGS